MDKSTDIYNRARQLSIDAMDDSAMEQMEREAVSIDKTRHDRLMAKMLSAVDSMTGRKFEVWTLLLQGKTQEDIAAILGIKRSTVQSFYKRGIKQIRAIVK